MMPIDKYMIKSAFWLLVIVALAFFALIVYPAMSIGVVEYGSDYIIWETGNVSQVVIDGVIVNVTTNIYGQYGLTGGTAHYISDINGTEGYKVVTTHDFWSILAYWAPLLLLFGLAIIAYMWPISLAPSVVYFLWLLAVHLPSIHADFLIYLLEVVGMAVCVVAGITKPLSGG